MDNQVKNILNKILVSERFTGLETDQSDQVAAGTYRTKNFEMEPKAQILFTKLPKGTSPDTAEKIAIHLDQLFAIVRDVLANKRLTQVEIANAKDIAVRIMHHAKSANLEKELSFVPSHLKTIEKHLTIDNNVINSKDLDLNKEFLRRFMSPPATQTPEPRDMDIDNSKFLLSRNLKAQRKLKIIDND